MAGCKSLPLRVSSHRRHLLDKGNRGTVKVVLAAHVIRDVRDGGGGDGEQLEVDDFPLRLTSLLTPAAGNTLGIVVLRTLLTRPNGGPLP